MGSTLCRVASNRAQTGHFLLDQKVNCGVPLEDIFHGMLARLPGVSWLFFGFPWRFKVWGKTHAHIYDTLKADISKWYFPACWAVQTWLSLSRRRFPSVEWPKRINEYNWIFIITNSIPENSLM